MKRTLDIIGALCGLILLAPVFLAIAAAILWQMGAPVFFFQTRAGRQEKCFRMVKFRTMTDARGPDGALLPDAQRLTRLGAWLRATSLDELPELWNVLRGDMSLVGPRPLLPEYLPHYTAEERLRHTLRPGITGLAQISGRNTIGWEDRLALDVTYVRTRSLWLDLRLLGATVAKVLRRDGVEVVPAARGRRLDHERAAR